MPRHRVRITTSDGQQCWWTKQGSIHTLSDELAATWVANFKPALFQVDAAGSFVPRGSDPAARDVQRVELVADQSAGALEQRNWPGGGTVSLLGFGGASLAVDAAQRGPVLAALDALLAGGVNLLDTAACYGDSELLLGELIASRGLRQRVRIISKCGHHQVLPDGRLRSLPVSMADVDDRLRRLRVDHLDALLLHSYDRDLLERGEAWQVLRDAQAAGKVGLIGYSGDNANALFAAGLPGCGIIECSLSIADQANATAVMMCKARGIAVIAKRPLANAAWMLLGTPRDTWNAHRAPYAERLAAIPLDPAAHGCASMAELALRFTIGLPGVTAAIVGASHPQQASANLAAAAAGPLPVKSVAAIAKAFGAAAQAASEPWLALN